ncbi:ATP-dependent endonuclease [Paenibacillus farraposensis]|uniref:ATP-dependent endonuclease n=1 Tax=Paenibacillus farraposensis TaxID=2807095 RepID=A0ABW4D6K8_9BACL|nr:AAA family ATPase [Paenibacillus farraposensis]MCC3381776.1 AAA family ATPase [Paenibacillus farraposensis]
MYLKYLQIVNYKNLKNARFNFSQGANTIIGENDSGKSNAVTALRLLLDDSYYYNSKRMKESDFAYDLGEWRGHWIIISVVFVDISSVDKQTEVCSEIVPEDENQIFLNSYINSGTGDIGTVTLFIRPLKSVRKKLYEAQTKEEFEDLLKEVKLSDYEFYYTSRSQTDFTDPTVYKTIVGDFETGTYSNPDDDDTAILGSKLNITDVQNHITVMFVDALRDVANEMRKPRNPIRRIVEAIEAQIDPTDIERIKDNINQLNLSISEVKEIGQIGTQINSKLMDMIGMVYSPEIALESQLNDEINALSRYLSIKPSNQNDMELLGLGHLNMIYMALKLVEFKFNRTRELINIMIIEEPEAHIHTHIQKTLFDNLKLTKDYTQVIMTTHSAHLSEASEISKINLIKTKGVVSHVMQPIEKLDDFGENKLRLKNLKLSECIERYLDAKRSVLLFSKGVLLVEGDGEEILIPTLVKKGLGVSLDELGIGLINVGGTAFEYIASLFDNVRIQRYCSIITDRDIQAVAEDSSHYSENAQKKGETRKTKLDGLFSTNPWVSTFYATNTFEIEFAKYTNNKYFVKDIIQSLYTQETTINRHKEALKTGGKDCANSVLTLANSIGKGWYATLLANTVDESVEIPEYIQDAIAYACQEVVTIDIKLKMVRYSLTFYPDSNLAAQDILSDITCIQNLKDKENVIEKYCNTFPKDQPAIFIQKIDEVFLW